MCQYEECLIWLNMMDEIFVFPEALLVMFYTHLHMMKNKLCVFFVSVIFATWLMTRVEARVEEDQDLR